MEPEWTLDKYRRLIQTLIDEDVWPTRDEYLQDFQTQDVPDHKLRAAFLVHSKTNDEKYMNLPNRGFQHPRGWDVQEKFLPSRIGTYFHQHYMEKRWNFRLVERPIRYDDIFSTYGAENLDGILELCKAIWDGNPHSIPWNPETVLFRVTGSWESRFKSPSGRIGPVESLYTIVSKHDRSVTNHQRRLLSGAKNPFFICACCMEDFFSKKRLDEHLGQSGTCSIFIAHHS